MSRTDGNRGNDCACIRVPEDRLQPRDNAMPQAADRAAGFRLQQPVARPVNDIARCPDALPEQPGLVVEYPGIAGPAWATQPHLHLPHVTNLQTFATFEPAQANSRRDSRVIDRPGHETDHFVPATGKIGDLQYRQDTVALELRRQSQAHCMQRMQRKKGNPGSEPGSRPATPGKE